MHTRRTFLSIGAGAIAALAMPTLEGCIVTKADLESWAQSVDTAATTVLEALGDSVLAGELATYLQQFDTAVTDFPTTGGTFTKILAIAQDIITILSDVGLPAGILTIADLAISVVVTFISNISNGTVTATVSTTSGVEASAMTSQRVVHALRTVTLTKLTSHRQAAIKWNAALDGTPYANHKVRVPLF
jgi:hypothetical protein